MIRHATWLVLLLPAILITVPGRTAGEPAKPLRPPAPPLPPPAGRVVEVATAAQLYDAADRAKPGDTILLADGRYNLSKVVTIRADRVALRGKSGDPDRVALDGGGTLGEGVAVTAATGVTIADLTVQNIRWNGIKLNSETGVHEVRIYNCVLRNVWQRGVKGVAVPERDRERTRPRGCRIEHCLFVNDRPKQFTDDPADTAQNFNGNYVGGIDAMYATGWVIRDNVFRGIRGRTREARGAVFLWVDTRDCIVERNVIVDCDSGICLGNSSRDAKTPVHATRCIARNNFITRAGENGILADYTKDCKILHNTVYDPDARLRRGIRIVHDAPGLVVANNLLVGPRVLVESESKLDLRNNREGAATDLFVNPAAGDMHLKGKADGVTDVGEPLPDAPEDIDGRKRGRKPDLGAHEFSPE